MLTLALTPPAHADEPIRAGEPRVLSEPAELMQVIDAFDTGDVFDVSLSLGFQQSSKTARIRRETFIAQPGLTTGDFTSDRLDVAKYAERTSRLLTRLDLGVYRDIAVYARMPIILANKRELKTIEGGEDSQELTLRGEPGEQLFGLPFQSPTRSGIEYLAFGLEFALMNQARNRVRPTWIGGIEARLNVSEPMHACNASPDALNQTDSPNQVKCARPSDYNRNGVDGDAVGPDGVNLEGLFTSNPEAGVSRGVTGLQVYSLVSKRVKYVEPYGGFRALFEFPTEKSDFGLTDFEGSLVNHPPLRGHFIAGMAVIPWEIRERYQRLTFDVRFVGTYVSEGRDYSELFDALGSSDARSLRRPLYSGYQRNPDFIDPDARDYPDDPTVSQQTASVVDPDSKRVYFTGITDVQQHAEFSLSGQLTWQAGEFVKFNLGLGYQYVQPHFLTFDAACNPDFSGDLYGSGPCRVSSTGDLGGTLSATGIPNPNYRRSLNSPGYRFKADNANLVDGWINVSVMF
ncbi:MAG: hypothetical protein JW751_22865 [Polyangiaceae bacterium]|nr:hypothetical protein [Polyangiaceae bacterium]